MKTALFLVFTAVCLAGTHPRTSSSDYRAQDSHLGLSIGAEALPPDQVRNTFSTDLRGYIVVEVAIYPPSEGVDVQPVDFALRCGADKVVRPADPRALVHTKQQQNAPKRSDIDIYPTAGIAYESGPYGRRVSHTEGVIVDAGGAGRAPGPASTDQDRRVMQLELEEKGLPNGKTTKAVSGYLYFPYPANKQKNVAYEIEYYGAEGKMRLQVK